MVRPVIVLFGVTGDLAKRKLIPGVWRLLRSGIFDRYAIVGVARESEQFFNDLLGSVKESLDIADNDPAWATFERAWSYCSVDARSIDGYRFLADHVQDREQRLGLSGHRLFYLAVASNLFGDITMGLSRIGLLRRTSDLDGDVWHRIVYEKPFGTDLVSAQNINEVIRVCIDEEQVYRIDHYLTKELVNNITLIRFTNAIFEPLWNNKHIAQIQIVLAESIGIEGRGDYYDRYGAIKDVVQNHILELLALIGMEPPALLTAREIRAQRAQLLSAVNVVDGIRGQYRGYVQEQGVSDGSTTETYAGLIFNIANDRWDGVPVYVKTGKKLLRKETTIHILFKEGECRLIGGCPIASNWLTIRITPDATWVLTINAKKPGTSDELVSVGMEFCHSCIFGERPPEDDYANLILQIVQAEQSVVVSVDEIESAWRIVETIEQASFPLYGYEPGSTGPLEMESLEKKYGIVVKT